MAAILNDLDAFLQADTPRTVPVNLGSNVNVNGTLGGTPVNTVVTNAANAAAHASSSGNPHNVNLTQISGDLDDINDGVTFFRTNANQVTGAGRGFNALNSSSEYIKSLKSTQLTVVGSNPSTGWVGDANGIRMYQSSVLKVNIPVSGAPSFTADITGGSNINITGNGIFNGLSTSTFGNAAVTANQSQNALNGIVGYADSGSGGTGVIAVGSGLAVALLASGRSNFQGNASFQGGISTTSTTLVSNLNADMVDGKHAVSLCSTVVPETGTCTVSGGGFNLISNVTSQQVRGNNSNGLIIETVSDERTKFDIHPETLGLDFIDSVNFITFRNKSKPGLNYHGWTAQNLIPLMNGKFDDALLHINGDGMYGSDYISMIGPMGLAIQQLRKEVNLLKSGKRKGRVIDVQKA
ncbi:tail fiber domain-containing protein [Nitrosomonas ureae]|uniref:Peptidase S74 domain-containing protein n=1 Tax=Nitrosomonas ureae TaxID=44577 RepID=A0A286ABV8_9PROT|nr:tail fiber domain-containing protein [Nitrosomonas ureae]SOD19383.1 hypothetical protein SAMN06297164_2368 [Nitrosomonas ureae]